MAQKRELIDTGTDKRYVRRNKLGTTKLLATEEQRTKTTGDNMMNGQSHLMKRRNLLRWLGVAALVVPVALSACANSTPPRRQGPEEWGKWLLDSL